MSHAEYAPKRLPVLTRLAMALRQIPAVEFALAKFKTLLSGRTNAEQAVARGFLPPRSVDAKDEGETDIVAAEPREPGIVAADDGVSGRAEPQTERVEADVVVADAIASDVVEIDSSETVGVEIETIADNTDGMDVEADEIAPVATASDELPEQETDAAADQTPVAVAEIAAEAVEAPRIAAEPIEIEAAELGVTDAVETPSLGAEDIAATEAASIARIEQEPVAVTPDIAEPDSVSAREALIRRRWKETGIMMWRGVGQSTLCIQGSTALLPPKPGETMPQYDRLEFRLIDGLIVCEGFVVEPPVPLKNRSFARAA